MNRHQCRLAELLIAIRPAAGDVSEAAGRCLFTFICFATECATMAAFHSPYFSRHGELGLG